MVRFPKIYLEEVIENQGYLFICVVERGIDLESYVNIYFNSRFKKLMDDGGAYFLNRYGNEIFEESGVVCNVHNNDQDENQAQWLGEFYALAQWKLGVHSSEMIKLIPFREIQKRYNVLHDLDLELAVDKVCKNIRELKTCDSSKVMSEADVSNRMRGGVDKL